MKTVMFSLLSAGLIALTTVLAACTPTPTTTTAATHLPDSAVEPIEVVSMTGIPQKLITGNSAIQITLKNTDRWPVISLHVVLRKLGARSYDFDFPFTFEKPLQPGSTTTVGSSIDNFSSDQPYFLDIEGTFQTGATFEFVWIPPTN